MLSNSNHPAWEKVKWLMIAILVFAMILSFGDRDLAKTAIIIGLLLEGVCGVLIILRFRASRRSSPPTDGEDKQVLGE